MPPDKKDKYFLDTSIVRPYLLSSPKYKQYLKAYFQKNPLYITKYIKMEYYRGCLRNLLDFYFHLSMDSVKTFGEAILIWGQKFQLRKHKVVIEFVATLFSCYKLNMEDINDKINALKILESYIVRLAIKLKRSFKDIGIDEVKCERANINLEGIDLNNNIEAFNKFIREFDDVKTCRSQCNIDRFFLEKYKEDANKFIEHLGTIGSKTKSENVGFARIVDKLEEAMKNNKFSCHVCKTIGDAVISLEAPRCIRLEHTDHSFDHLCEVINQPHYKHPPEITIAKAQSPSS